MKYLFFSLLVCIFLCSCATLFNTPYTSVNVHTRTPVLIAHDNDTFRSNGSYLIRAERSNLPLRLSVITDSATRNLIIRPKLSSAYYANWANYSIGYLIDLTTLKRFTYPHDIYVDPSKPNGGYKYFPLPHKGAVLIQVGYPLINSFDFYAVHKKTNQQIWGFAGLSLGADVYYRKDRFISLYGSFAYDNLLPFPFPFGHSEEKVPYLYLNTMYAGLTHNHRWRHFSVGYGLSTSANFLSFGYNEQGRDMRGYSYAHNVGLLVNGYVYTGPRFAIGVIYRPDVVKLYADRKDQYGHYEHFLGLDLSWRLPVNKKRFHL